MTMMENNYFFIKRYISKHRAKHDVLVIFILLLILLQETKNPNVFDKNCTQGKPQESSQTFKASSEEVTVMYSEKMKEKCMAESLSKSFFR